MATQNRKKKVDFKFLKLAFDLAKSYNFDKSMDYYHCAVIARGGKVLSIGYNSRKRNSIVEQYKVQEHTCTIHAEIAAILAKRKKIRFEGSKIYVVRIKSNGTVGMSKPCEMCELVLEAYGIKRAIYTVSETEYGVLRIH